MDSKKTLQQQVAGVLLGTAVGDAIGLPREALSARRARRMFGDAPLGHRFFFGRGMMSDDTEHTCMVAQAILASGGDPERFARSFAWRLRCWIWGLPAGVGLGTLKGILRLWIGFPPRLSGVRSAGNGPAMRSGLLGVVAGADIKQLEALVKASTRLTHRDERAEHGALAIALACNYAATHYEQTLLPAHVLSFLKGHIPDGAIRESLDVLARGLEDGVAPMEMAQSMGMKNGISGYVLHTVPMALYCWLRHISDFRAAVEEVVMMGGDADTTGAIVGALAGATLGVDAIPSEWIDGLLEWPRSVNWIRRLAETVTDQISNGEQVRVKPLRLFWPGVLVRNVFFTVVVLMHCLRRALPPY